MINIAFAPILLAGVVPVIIGWIWYGPHAFGLVWMRLSNPTPEQIERGKKHSLFSAFIGLLASMLVAYVMAYFGVALQVYGWFEALELGLWTWAGFAAPVLLGTVLWNQKPVRLYLIDASYWLVSFVAMALVLFSVSAFVAPGVSQMPPSGVYLNAQ